MQPYTASPLHLYLYLCVCVWTCPPPPPQIMRDAMLFESEAGAQAFQQRCAQERVSLRGVTVVSVDGRFSYNLAGPGAEDAGAAVALYT